MDEDKIKIEIIVALKEDDEETAIELALQLVETRDMAVDLVSMLSESIKKH